VVGLPSPDRAPLALNGVGDLAVAVDVLQLLAAELRGAQAAGWSLVEPMRGGHLLAARPSRRQRAQLPKAAGPTVEVSDAPRLRWRLRLIDEPPAAGDEVLRLDMIGQTPVLAWARGGCGR